MIRRFAPLVAVFALIGGAALAHDGGPGRGGPRGPKGPIGPALHSISALELDANQQAAFDDLKATLEANRPDPEELQANRPDFGGDREAFRELQQTRQAKMKQLVVTFENELAKNKPDAALLHTLVDDAPNGQAPAFVHDNLDALLAFQATLTPAQRQEWSADIAERRAEHEARRAEHEERRGEACEGGPDGEGGPRGRGRRGQE